MDVADEVVGKLVLGVTSTVLLVLAFWVNSYPFVDGELSIYSVLPDPQWFLIFCSLWGLTFIGGLMCHTLYHLHKGVTCGGKTTLANRLCSVLTPVEVFHQDKYFLPDDSPTHVPVVGLAQPHHNYDVLSALDMDAMHRDVLTTISGRSTSHEQDTNRAPGRVALSNKSFLIVEGFTVLNYKPLLELCDLRYYLVLEYGECVARRVFRLYDPPDVAGYFESCVWPEHVRYRAEMEKEPRVKLLDGTRTDALEVVLADVKALGATEIA